MKVGQYCAENNKPFGFNLSAVFLIEFELEKVLSVIKYADFVFANEDEQAAIHKKLGVDNVNDHLAKMPKENLKMPIRSVIMTQGGEPVQIASFDHSIPEVEVNHWTVDVPKVDTDLIIDTNGAGDSFVGAFFASLANGATIKESIENGNVLSGVVIQKSGCVFE